MVFKKKKKEEDLPSNPIMPTVERPSVGPMHPDYVPPQEPEPQPQVQQQQYQPLPQQPQMSNPQPVQMQQPMMQQPMQQQPPQMPMAAWEIVPVPSEGHAFRNTMTGEVLDEGSVLLKILNILEEIK